MAASITVTRDGADNRTRGITRIHIAWTAHTDGSLTALATGVRLNGLIRAMTTDPGSTAPTDNYDISLVDQYGADRLAGGGVDRDTANSETKVFDPPIPVFEGDTLALTIANNSQNGATGVIVFYIETFGGL